MRLLHAGRLEVFEDHGSEILGRVRPGMAIARSRLLDGAKSLFDREDALVQEQLGADAMARYKESQTDSRMTVLTMAATYADVDWDDAVR